MKISEVIKLYRRLSWKPLGDLRLSRREYWTFYLFVEVIPFAIFMLIMSIFISMAVAGTSNQPLQILGALIELVYVIYAIMTFLTMWSADNARLHDTGHSAWARLYWLIPWIGNIIYLVILLSKTKTGENNKYFFDQIVGVENWDKYQMIEEPSIFDKKMQNKTGRQPKIDNDEYWAFTSFVYSKIKQTSIFRTWKREQFDCQFGKCAICGKPMELRYTQTDHIEPRYKRGNNYSKNLALVHKKCNENKGAKTGYKRPEWIKDNKYSVKLDDKVFEITEEVRKDYPTKFPDDLFTKP